MTVFWERHKKKCILLLWIAVVLASVKSLFTDTGFDNAYTVAMSFRHLNGDRMFEQMWEAHQTSIFFTDFFMWLYHLIVPSYTGVVFYLQIVGTLFFVGIAVLLYRLFKGITGSEIAQLAIMFFIMFRAKQTPFPDFANLQIGFSVLLFLCLIAFVWDQKKKRYLFFAAVFLCLEVLSYPSCLLAYFPAAAILFWKTKERWKNWSIFTGLCIAFGGIYAGYFIIKIGFREFIQNLSNIFYSDSHSEASIVGLWGYFSGILTALTWIIISSVLAWLLCWGIDTFLKKKISFFETFGLILLFSEILLLFLQKKIGLDWTCIFYILPLLLMALSFFSYKNMDEKEKFIWQVGILFAITSFVSTWLLTDLGLITMISYMVLGGVVSFIALRHRKKEVEVFFLIICMLVIIHRGLVVFGYANSGGEMLVPDLRKIILSGPSAGIMCDYMTCYKITYDAEDHKKFINEEDSFFLVADWMIDSLEFMLPNADISNYSTINTPIYNERLLDYLEQYPEKKPTVVAVSCFYGTMMVPDTSWIMEWVNENYEAVGDGRYWRYYRARK